LLLVCIQILILYSTFISYVPFFFKLFLFFSFAVASTSVDCYSNSLRFLQLWKRGQRIYSTFHQIYPGKSSELYLSSKLV
jgi:hypothetical protein